MLRAGRYPKLLGRRFGPEKVVNHACGHESVTAAVDEEHGLRATTDAVDGRKITEIPPVAPLGEQGCGVKQGERRQRELLIELLGKLIKGAGVAAILHESYHTARSEERRVGKECRSRWSP